ncbi:MAG TPA: hypothetical protein VJW93_10715 [Candidatus Acidoferrales bacterium]|nr:hypothetical protein [Candidatus Acidoferrales bacterium]
MTSMFFVTVQMLAAFVIFLAGFAALFAVLMACLAVGWILYWCVIGLRERLRFPGAKTVWLMRLRRLGFASVAGNGRN